MLTALPDVPRCTVTRYGSSSLQTIRMAALAIKAGEGDVFVAAGVECVSRYAKGTSDGLPHMKNPRFADARERTAQRSRARQGAPGACRWAARRLRHNGQTAETVAAVEGVPADRGRTSLEQLAELKPVVPGPTGGSLRATRAR